MIYEKNLYIDDWSYSYYRPIAGARLKKQQPTMKDPQQPNSDLQYLM